MAANPAIFFNDLTTREGFVRKSNSASHNGRGGVPFLMAVSIGLAILLFSNTHDHRKIDLNPGPHLLPAASLPLFALGYNEILGDTLWLRTIQDFDYCEARLNAKVKAQDVKCQRGWVYHMIDSVTELAPRFRQPYLSGALMLTVVVNDIEGSSAIFDKAVKRFPNDGPLAFAAAYQALIEEKNPAKASDLLIVAGRNGQPPWVFALAARLQQREGQLILAQTILQQAKELNLSGPGAERIQQRLDDVEAELAKQPKH